MSGEKIHEIQKAYGVIHGGSHFSGIRGEYGVCPSWELKQDLATLYPGTKVGIEKFDPKEVKKYTYTVNGRRFFQSRQSRVYWKEIVDNCRENNLEIVYLDDFQTFRAYAAKCFEQQDNKEVLRQQMRASIPISIVADTADKMYQAGVEARYLHEVKREEKILERTARYQPDVIIVGQGHGDYFKTNPDYLSTYNLMLANYKREGLGIDPECFQFLYPSRYPVPATLFDDSIPDSRYSLERKLLLREYRSVTEGRILPDKTPYYRGSWDLGCPKYGLFEVYINNINAKGKIPEGGEISGVIEDVLGTSDFTGKVFFGGSIYLEKTYRKEESSPNAVEGVIKYIGHQEGKGYKGKYFFQNIDKGIDFNLDPVPCIKSTIG